jgi:hypothetical protein
VFWQYVHWTRNENYSSNFTQKFNKLHWFLYPMKYYAYSTTCLSASTKNISISVQQMYAFVTSVFPLQNHNTMQRVEQPIIKYMYLVERKDKFDKLSTSKLEEYCHQTLMLPRNTHEVDFFLICVCLCTI